MLKISTENSAIGKGQIIPQRTSVMSRICKYEIHRKGDFILKIYSMDSQIDFMLIGYWWKECRKKEMEM